MPAYIVELDDVEKSRFEATFPGKTLTEVEKVEEAVWKIKPAAPAPAPTPTA